VELSMATLCYHDKINDVVKSKPDKDTIKRFGLVNEQTYPIERTCDDKEMTELKVLCEHELCSTKDFNPTFKPKNSISSHVHVHT